MSVKSNTQFNVRRIEHPPSDAQFGVAANRAVEMQMGDAFHAHIVHRFIDVFGRRESWVPWAIRILEI